MADSGEEPGAPAPLFLDQTEARRAEKIFFWRPPPPPPPLSEGLDDHPHPPLSQGLDQTLNRQDYKYFQLISL